MVRHTVSGYFTVLRDLNLDVSFLNKPLCASRSGLDGETKKIAKKSNKKQIKFSVLECANDGRRHGLQRYVTNLLNWASVAVVTAVVTATDGRCSDLLFPLPEILFSPRQR